MVLLQTSMRKERVRFLVPLKLTIECDSVYVEPKKYIYKKTQKWV